MDHFEQRRFFNKRRVDFEEEGILYSYGNLINMKQLYIDYEEILYHKTTRQVKTDWFNLFVCILSGLTVLKSLLGIYDNPYGIYKGLLPFSLLFFIVFLIVTVLGRAKYLLIETQTLGQIKLFDQVSSKNTLDQFLKELSIKTKSFLKAKYTDIDPDISKETQLENLFWLKKNKIISKNEYEALKAKLMK